MNLSDLDLSHKYRTSQNDVIEQFVIPCLKRSIRYDRAVGFFSGAALKLALNGIIEFIKKEDSKIRILTSPRLREDDINDIENGLKQEREVIESKILDEIKTISETADRTLLATLGWLISHNRLEMKIGDINTSRHSIFHDKLGIFRDSLDNRVVFYGSLNETYLGYKEHYDAIRVITSWTDPKEKIAEEERDFELLWNDLDAIVKTYEISDAIRDGIVKYAPKSEEELVELILQYGHPLTIEKSQKTGTFNPREIRPWTPQEKALLEIKRNNYHGILKMATGTGKTAVALLAIEQYFKDFGRYGNRIIILVPSKVLGLQWEDFLQNNTSRNDLVYRFDSKTKVSEIRDLMRVWQSDLRKKKDTNVFLVLSIQSLHNFDVSNEIVDVLIGDEVHSYGTENIHHNLTSKLRNSRYVIGLSATPERYYDSEGTKRVLEFFGPIIFRYTIKQAQDEPKLPGRESVLSKYNYYPFLTKLTDKEEKAVKELSEKISRTVASNFDAEITEDDTAISAILKWDLQERARYLKKAKNKLEVLSKILKNYDNTLERCIVYCEDRYQLEQAVSIFDNLGIDSYSKYHSAIYRRDDILKLFKRNKSKYVLSIHCLDQGVDVPECHSLILLSSSGNPREYIQRRGRVLRNYENKSIVRIFDIFAFPKEQNDIYRGMIEAQLLRAWEFLDCSQTPEEETNFDLLRQEYDISQNRLFSTIESWRGN